jgi:hypothetical protein
LRSDLRGDDNYDADAEFAASVPNFDSLDLRGTPQPQVDDADVPADELYDEQEQAPVEDAQPDVLHFGDDDIIAHDIWFVALGASGLDHAGMKSFLRENRSKIRGAFMVNLDSIGAGNLTLLTSEGRVETRKTDRRVMRMLTRIADDLHIPVDHAGYSWSDTDATAAMRKSVRAVTIMGMENGVPALSHTADDVIDEVDPSQIGAVAAMICELARRA